MWRVKPCQADRESCQFPHTTCEISSYIKADTEFPDIESPFRERTHFLSSSTPAVFRFFFLTNSIGFNKWRINWVSEGRGTPQMASPTNVFSSAAQETTCNLSPDFQKVVLWNARLRSIAIRSGQRTPENIGRGKKRHKRRSCWETVHALCIKTSTSLQQTHRNTHSHQKATANQTCPDSRHGNFQVISKCFFFFSQVFSWCFQYETHWNTLKSDIGFCGSTWYGRQRWSMNWKPLDMGGFYRNWWFKW